MCGLRAFRFGFPHLCWLSSPVPVLSQQFLKPRSQGAVNYIPAYSTREPTFEPLHERKSLTDASDDASTSDPNNQSESDGNAAAADEARQDASDLPDESAIALFDKETPPEPSQRPVPLPVTHEDAPAAAPSRSIPIPVIHVDQQGGGSPTSSRSSTEEQWVPKMLLENRKDETLQSLSRSRDLLQDLRHERGELERDLRLFSESNSLMSDDSVASLRQRMARRIADIENSFNAFADGRSKSRRQMKSLFGNGEWVCRCTQPELLD